MALQISREQIDLCFALNLERRESTKPYVVAALEHARTVVRTLNDQVIALRAATTVEQQQLAFDLQESKQGLSAMQDDFDTVTEERNEAVEAKEAALADLNIITNQLRNITTERDALLQTTAHAPRDASDITDLQKQVDAVSLQLLQVQAHTKSLERERNDALARWQQTNYELNAANTRALEAQSEQIRLGRRVHQLEMAQMLGDERERNHFITHRIDIDTPLMEQTLDQNRPSSPLPTPTAQLLRARSTPFPREAPPPTNTVPRRPAERPSQQQQDEHISWTADFLQGQRTQHDRERRARVASFPRFKGEFRATDTKWRDWLDRFKFQFETEDDEFLLLALSQTLDGPALHAYKSLRVEERGLDFYQVLDALDVELVNRTGGHNIALMNQLNTISQGPNESIADLWARMELAGRRVTDSGMCTDDGMAALIISRAPMAVSDPILRKKLLEATGTDTTSNNLITLKRLALNFQSQSRNLQQLTGGSNGRQGQSSNRVWNNSYNRNSHDNNRPDAQRKGNGAREDQCTVHPNLHHSNAQCFQQHPELKRDGPLPPTGQQALNPRQPINTSWKGSSSQPSNAAQQSNGNRKWKGNAQNKAVFAESQPVDEPAPTSDFHDVFGGLSNNLVVTADFISASTIQSSNASPMAASLYGGVCQRKMGFYGVDAKILVDPCSQATLVSLTFLEEVAKMNRWSGSQLADIVQLDANTTPGMRSETKHQVPIKGTVILPLEWHGRTTTCYGLLRDDRDQERRTYDILLGTNCMEDFDFFLISGRDRELCNLKGIKYVSPQSVICAAVAPVAKTATPICHRVALIDRTFLAPGERAVITLQSKSSLRTDAKMAFFYEKLPDTQSLWVGDALVTSSSDTTFEFSVPVDNKSLESIVLRPGDSFGLLEELPVQLETINPLICAKTTFIQESKNRTNSLLAMIDWEQSPLSIRQRNQLVHLIAEFAHVFAVSDSELTQTDGIQHRIETGSAMPIKQPLRRIPFGYQAEVGKAVEGMLEQGVIRPSKSPWSSPPVLIRKQDGSLRFCIDYRQLNNVTVKDAYPIPNIDDVLSSFSGKKFFTTLDLFSGYYQISMDPESRPKTAFSTTNGHYEFNVMPFGVTNAPATFERYMEQVFQGLNGTFLFVYIDDIVIASSSFEEHLEHIRLVLDRLQSAQLKLKPKKCSFGRASVAFLGHFISADGLRMDPDKIARVKEFPVPKSVKDIQRFLGLVGYYRRFIAHFGSIARPMTQLTEKDVKFFWSEQCNEAFEKLRNALCKEPVLIFPDFVSAASGLRIFIVETDASPTGIGAVLYQEGPDGQPHPIAYYSKACTRAERNYPITELEALAVVRAVEKWQYYLRTFFFRIITDHQPLKWIFDDPRCRRMTRWTDFMQGFDYEIVYRPGRLNAAADALSRMHEETDPGPDEPDATDRVLCASIAADIFASVQANAEIRQWLISASVEAAQTESQARISRWNEEVRHDFADVIRQLTNGQSIAGYRLDDDTLIWISPRAHVCKVVPVSAREPLFLEFHSGTFGGHLGDKKTFSAMARRYFWPKMRSDIYTWTRKCLACAATRNEGKLTPPMQPISSSKPREIVGVDICEVGLTSRGNRYMLVFVDHFTKFVKAYAIADKRAETVTELFMERYVTDEGPPSALLSDRGTEFLNEILGDALKMLNIRKLNTAGYKPSTNGITENMNRTLLRMLRRSTIVKTEWDRRLPFVCFAYNISEQRSTGESPFFLQRAADARWPSTVDQQVAVSRYQADSDDYKTALLATVQATIEQVRQRLDRVRDEQRRYYDKWHRAVADKFHIGDRVMVHMPGATARSRLPKLEWTFIGPCRITKLTPSDAEVQMIDSPDDPVLFVPISRLRKAPRELPNLSYAGTPSQRRRRSAATIQGRVAPAKTPGMGADTRVGHHHNLRPRGAQIGNLVESTDTNLAVCYRINMDETLELDYDELDQPDNLYTEDEILGPPSLPHIATACEQSPAACERPQAACEQPQAACEQPLAAVEQRSSTGEHRPGKPRLRSEVHKVPPRTRSPACPPPTRHRSPSASRSFARRATNRHTTSHRSPPSWSRSRDHPGTARCRSPSRRRRGSTRSPPSHAEPGKVWLPRKVLVCDDASISSAAPPSPQSPPSPVPVASGSRPSADIPAPSLPARLMSSFSALSWPSSPLPDQPIIRSSMLAHSARLLLVGGRLANRVRVLFGCHAKYQGGSFEGGSFSTLTTQWPHLSLPISPRFVIVQGGEEDYTAGGIPNLLFSLDNLSKAILSRSPDVSILFWPPFLPGATVERRSEIAQAIASLSRPPSVWTMPINGHWSFDRIVGTEQRAEGGPLRQRLVSLAQAAVWWMEQMGSGPDLGAEEDLGC